MVTSVKDTTPITRSISSVTQTLCDFVASSLAIENPKVVSSRTSNTGNRSYREPVSQPVLTPLFYRLPARHQSLVDSVSDWQIESMYSIVTGDDHSSRHAREMTRGQPLLSSTPFCLRLPWHPSCWCSQESLPCDPTLLLKRPRIGSFEKEHPGREHLCWRRSRQSGPSSVHVTKPKSISQSAHCIRLFTYRLVHQPIDIRELMFVFVKVLDDRGLGQNPIDLSIGIHHTHCIKYIQNVTNQPLLFPHNLLLLPRCVPQLNSSTDDANVASGKME